MESKRFLIVFLKFSGYLEILFGLVIIFLGPMMDNLSLPYLPFWHLSFGVSLSFFGILLLISASDIDRYAIIPLISCIYRWIIAGFQIYTAITISAIRIFMIAGGIFDIIAPILIVYLLVKNKFLFPIKDLMKRK
ncbi:MAG: hypothetical protein ACTSVL_03870 [Promethearchaeota archaeon]